MRNRLSCACVHSQSAGAQVKQHGKPNNLIELILQDDFFNQYLTREFLDDKILKPEQYIGRSKQLTLAYSTSEDLESWKTKGGGI